MMRSKFALACCLAAAALPARAQSPAAPATPAAPAEPAASTAPYRCTDAQQTALEQARQGAMARLQTAQQYMTRAPDGFRSWYHEDQPPERPDQDWRRNVITMAQRLFGDAQFDTRRGLNTLRQMQEQLRGNGWSPVAVCSPASDRYCRERDAYVENGTPPIHICPSFFTYEAGISPARNLADKQVRGLVHESAHLAGIGNPFNKEYCPLFDCATNCGAPDTTADSWSHFAHCLVGQPPDVQGGGRIESPTSGGPVTGPEEP